MAFKSSGDSDKTILISGSAELKRLRVAVAFGTSMRPFLKPGTEIRSEPVKAASIRLGDMVIFKSRSEALITHRVVKIFRQEGQVAFLTKGDSRLDSDSPIFQEHIFGRVIQVGGVNIRSLKWRVLGRIIAWISYGQAVFYKILAKSRLNQFRHWLEKKNWLPSVPLRPWFAGFSNPVSWLTFFRSVLDTCETGRLRRLFHQKITIRPWTIQDVEPMTQVWNEAFPSYRTTAERLDKMFCRSPWFDRSRCFVAVSVSQGFLGWFFVRQGTGKKTGAGFIDVFALTEAGWRMKLDRIFFQEILEWFKKRQIRQVSLNPHPAPEHSFGIPLTRLVLSSSACGFELTEGMIELRVAVEAYHAPRYTIIPEGLSFRTCEEGDDIAIHNFLIRNDRLDTRLYYDNKAGPEGILVATLHGTLVGFIRWIPEDRMKDYSQIAWVWTLSESKRRRGYALRLLVDKASRGRGIGAALMARCLECLFDAGCEEISIMVGQEKPLIERFYKRFGFTRAVCYAQSRWSAKH